MLQRWQAAQLDRVAAEAQAEVARTRAAALSRPKINQHDIPQFTPHLDRLFGKLDDVVANVFSEKLIRNEPKDHIAPSEVAKRAKSNAIFVRMGGIAAIRAQVDFYYQVASSPKVNTVCEVGFNAGHSAALWLSANPLLKVFSFDYLSFPYSQHCVAFLQDRFPGRLEVVGGDSARTVPNATIPNGCDLIHIDGKHQYQPVIFDTLNMLSHANLGALFLYDDVCDPSSCSVIDPYAVGPALAVCDLQTSSMLAVVKDFFVGDRQFALYRPIWSGVRRAQSVPGKLPCSPRCWLHKAKASFGGISESAELRRSKWRSTGAMWFDSLQRHSRPNDCKWTVANFSQARPEYQHSSEMHARSYPISDFQLYPASVKSYPASVKSYPASAKSYPVSAHLGHG